LSVSEFFVAGGLMPTGLPTHGFGLLPGFGQHHVNYPQVPGRYYEIGLDVSDEAPHTIRKTVELIGLNGACFPFCRRMATSW